MFKLFFILGLLPTTMLLAQKLHNTVFFKNEYLSVKAGLFESASKNNLQDDIDTVKWLKVSVKNTSTCFNLALLKNDDSTHKYPCLINKLGFDVQVIEDWNYRKESYDIHILKPNDEYSFFMNLTNLYYKNLLTQKRLSSKLYNYTFLYRIYNTDFMAFQKDSIISGKDWFEYTVPPHIQLCNFDCEAIDTTEKHIMYSDEQKAHEAKKKESFWQKIKSFFSALF